MAVYRLINITYWQDPFVLKLTPEEKFFYIYLMTNSKTTQCGVYEISKNVMVFETGYNLETIEKLLTKFIEYNKIIYDNTTNELFLINWMRYHNSESPKVRSLVVKELNNIKSDNLYDKLKDVLIQYGYSMDTVLIEKRNINININIKKNIKIKNKEEEVKNEEIFDVIKNEKCFNLAKRLFELILENNDKAKKPNFSKWSEDIEKLYRIDKHEYQEISEIIEWTQKDNFWHKNILSAANLRKHFNRLILDKRNKHYAKREKSTTDKRLDLKVSDMQKSIDEGGGFENYHF